MQYCGKVGAENVRVEPHGGGWAVGHRGKPGRERERVGYHRGSIERRRRDDRRGRCGVWSRERPRLRRRGLSGAAKAGESAYPLGPRVAGPQQRRTRGSAPSTPGRSALRRTVRERSRRIPPRRADSEDLTRTAGHHVAPTQRHGGSVSHRERGGGGAVPPRAHRRGVRRWRPAAQAAGGSRGAQRPPARPRRSTLRRLAHAPQRIGPASGSRRSSARYAAQSPNEPVPTLEHVRAAMGRVVIGLS